ncbi:hypothetical protein BJX61DRAFT_179681 [Aspergillus egyptiacus]|nr:hypothetical protein BJX61DRAFT_179681 [Aspergillus egyptiacus]
MTVQLPRTQVWILSINVWSAQMKPKVRRVTRWTLKTLTAIVSFVLVSLGGKGSHTAHCSIVWP